jgi:signal transduction histidine kinase
MRHMATPRRFRQYRLESRFELENPNTYPLWAVYLLHMPHGGEVSVNGIAIGKVPTATEHTTVWLTRPFLFQIPSALLQQGANHLVIDWSENQSLSMVSNAFIGPFDTLLPVYQQRYFWQNTMAEVALVHALVIAAILLGIFSLRRHQLSYAQMGLGAIGFSVIVFTFMLPPLPWWFYPYWRSLHIAGIGLFTCCAWIFLIRECQPNNRWYPRLCIAWAAIGPCAYLINFWLTDLTYFAQFEPVWGITSGAIGVYAVAALAYSMYREWSVRKLIFVLATAIAIVMGISDIALQSTSKSMFGNVGYSLQAVSPLWFTALTVVLVLDFAASLMDQEQQGQRLKTRLADQQTQLLEMHEKEREREREIATQQERQRIMQDMHDGLGSQLITTLAMSERGALSKEQMSMLLRECIDDLRLAIDTTAVEEHPFAMAAANLRFRMEPRLRAAGLTLQWDIAGLAQTPTVSASHSLALLRIMQEALTNVLKHAQATRVEIQLSIQSDTLMMTIQDNGTGFDVATVSAGKGLSGMHKRARSIGANLEIVATIGTRVRIELPLSETETVCTQG